MTAHTTNRVPTISSAETKPHNTDVSLGASKNSACPSRSGPKRNIDPFLSRFVTYRPSGD